MKIQLPVQVSAVWRYKGFVFGMVWREFRGRYLGSLLGSIWSILNPMAMIFIYTVIFSKIMQARLPGVDDTMGFGVFLCAGILNWGFFAELLGRCPNIFIEQATLLKKVSFPRITLPVILFLSCSINYFIIFTIFIVFLVSTGRFPGWVIVAFLPLLLIQQSIALGIGMMLGALNVFFRDIGQLLGIIIQFWFWFTPIIYPISILPDKLHGLISLNPMTAIVLYYQQIILFGQWPDFSKLWYQIILAIVALGIGFRTFRKLSDDIVDEL